MELANSDEIILEMNLDNLLVLLDEIDIDNASQLEKQLLEGYLERLVENVFKLQYWEVEKGRDYRHWQAMVSNSRNCILELLQQTPSLKRYMAKIYPKLYQNAVNLWQVKFYIPNNTPIELQQLLKKNYFG